MIVCQLYGRTVVDYTFVLRQQKVAPMDPRLRLLLLVLPLVAVYGAGYVISAPRMERRLEATRFSASAIERQERARSQRTDIPFPGVVSEPGEAAEVRSLR